MRQVDDGRAGESTLRGDCDARHHGEQRAASVCRDAVAEDRLPVVAVAVLVVGCGGSSSVRTARLSGAYTVRGQGHTIYVGVETEGTCLGAQRQPRLEPIEIDERSGGEAVITATVRYFPLEGHACFGVGLGYEQAIHTRRPVRQLTIYDGSESPPRRLGLPVMTRAKFREQMRGARHNARVARRDREAD